MMHLQTMSASIALETVHSSHGWDRGVRKPCRRQTVHIGRETLLPKLKKGKQFLEKVTSYKDSGLAIVGVYIAGLVYNI